MIIISNNIRGITVEIGGNTGPLTSALKDVDKVSRDLQGELKEVNRQLKFEPQNTELLRQKQTMLTKEISNTKDKLVTLKEAEKQAQEQFKQGKISEEQYRALQREIIKTESTLKSLQKQAAGSNVVLSKISETAGKVGDAAGNISNKMKPATLAIAGAGTAAVKMGADYEDSLAKVSTIADTSKKSIGTLSDEVINLSNETGTSANEINEALYQAISAGADTAKATGLVEVAVKSAKGGFTDTATAVDGLTSVLNTYNMKTEEADKLANQFLITQNLGKTTFGDLASSIGKVAPTAHAAGVQTNELLSSIAALTANGINTAESMTGMKAALSNIIKPSKEASDMAKSLGLDFSATALQTKGLSGFMAELKEKTGGNLDTMSKLFGSTEALNTVLTLTSENGVKVYDNSMKEMKTNTTAVDDAFNKVNNTTSNNLKKSLNELKNQAIEIAKMIMPTVNQIIAKISELIKSFAAISPAGKRVILTTLLIIAAISPVTKIIHDISHGIQGLIKMLLKLPRLINGVSSAIKLLFTHPHVMMIAAIVAAIALLVVGIKHLWDTSEGFRTAVLNIISSIQKAWKGLMTFFAGIPAWWNNLWTQVGRFFVDCWNGIIAFFTTTIPAWIQSVIQCFRQLPGKIWAILVDIVRKVVQWGGNLVTTAQTEIPKFVNKVVELIGQLPGKMLNIGKDIVHGIWAGISNAAVWLRDKITGFCKGIVNGFKGALGIHSPSKLFADVVGKNIALGIGQGFTENMKSVAASMTAAIPTNFDTSIKVNTAMAAAYGGYSVPVSLPQSVGGSSSVRSSDGISPIIVNQNFEGKVPTPAENARLTRNSVQQVILQLRKK